MAIKQVMREDGDTFTLGLEGGAADQIETLARAWTLKHPRATRERLGWLPCLVLPTDPRPAKEQLDSNYQHGGGWRPFSGFELLPDGSIHFPGDPVMHLIGEITIRDETVRLYECAWVMILQKDGSFEISRMD